MISVRNDLVTSSARRKNVSPPVRKFAAAALRRHVSSFSQSTRITGLLALLGFTGILTGIYLRSLLPARIAIVFSLVLVGLISGLLLLLEVSARITTAAHSSGARFAVVGAQALVTLIPFIALGQVWFVSAGLLAASMVPFIRGRRARAWFVILIVIIVAVSSSLHSLRLSETAWLLCAPLGAGLVLSGVLQLIAAIAQLRARRNEQMNSVIIRERTRFSRDLHDLLGYSLSAIALKAELAKRTVADRPSLAADAIVDVISATRQALAEVRTAAHGYRNISLATEASATASLLGDAGIQTHIELAYGALTEDADSVLAAVLREAATNVLRHSAARNCSITVNEIGGDWIRLQVTNDGVSSADRRDIRGDGLANMASRLKEIGGELSARSTGSPGSTPRRFQVTVELPGRLSYGACASEATD